MERKIAKLSGHVIVCGLGRMGLLVATELHTAGRDMVIIDAEPRRTAVAEENKLLYVLGDATDEQVLKFAGVERAKVLVAALTTDADNVFVTLSARGLNTSLRIIARAQEQSAQDKLLKAGASRVVCPQIIGATRVADVVLRPAVVDFVEVAHRGVELELDQMKLTPHSQLIGKTLRELSLPSRIGVHVVAIQRASGEPVYHPTADMTLEAGDVLILVGKRGAATAIEKLQPETV